MISSYLFIITQSICDPAQGFGNAVLFVFLSKVILFRLLRGVYKYLTKWCCCFFQREKPLTVFSESDPVIIIRSKKNQKPVASVTYSSVASEWSDHNGESTSLTNSSLSEVEINYGSSSTTPSIT